MTFLAMIIAVALLQLWGSAGRVHHDEWFSRLCDQLAKLGLPNAVSLALSIAIPVVLAMLLLDMLGGLLFGLAWIACAVLILLYAFGRGEFRQLMQRYRDYCQNGDFEAAYLRAQSELKCGVQEFSPESPAQSQQQIQAGLFYEGYQRWFSVLFYFVLLGPVGALAYRLLQLRRQGAASELAEKALFFVDWLPVRVLAAAFSLTGDFLSSGDELLASVRNTEDSAAAVLYTVGRAALGLKEEEALDSDSSFSDTAAAEITQLGSLLSRSAATWVVFISLIVFLG